MLKRTKLASAFIFAALTASTHASAEVPRFLLDNGGRTSFSSYSTQPGDQAFIDVEVTIFRGGQSGEYRPKGSSQKGSLFNIKAGADRGDGLVPDLSGNWKFGNTVGTFFWFFDGKKFTGSYRKSNDGKFVPTDGSWNGGF